MTKQERLTFIDARYYCISHQPTAMYFVSPFVRLLFHGIENTDDGPRVFVSSEYDDDKTFYHNVRLLKDKFGREYFSIMSLKVFVDELVTLKTER